MTTHSGYVMTLANSIIGVSLLAMPYCFKQCGLLLGSLLLLFCNVVTRLACHFLIKSGVMCRRKNYEHVGYHAFGVTGKVLVELGVIGFLMGTSVAFFVVIGDLAPAIISKLLGIENNEDLRTNVLLVTGIFIILPLSLLRNIESLAAISTATMLFYLLLVCKVFSESFTHLAAADWVGKVNWWRPEGILQCFPIFSMALSCQTQVFEIMEVLPNPSVERMNAVVRAAVGLCTGLYVAVGFFGYIAYSRQQFAGNILLSFTSSTSSDLFQLGFVASVALSFPIVVFPCRASLNSFLFNKGSQYLDLNTTTSYIPDARFKLLTAGIIATGLTTGLLIPNIEFVLGFVGSTIGVAVCIIFPSAAFVRISGKKTTERLAAQCVCTFGLFVMILGMYGNFSAAIDDHLHHHPGEVSPLLHSPVPPVLVIPKELPPIKSDDVKIRPLPATPPPKMPEARKEPPVPIETASSVSPKKVPPPIADLSRLKSVSPEPSFGAKVPVLSKEAKTGDQKSPEVEGKKIDAIHLDAIAREEHQLKEDDKLEKKEETRQGEELLKKLKEHQEEQKQLLMEQQNILEEIKIRDGDPVPPVPVQPIEPQKFNENIEKIQEVIDDLKEKKQALDKTKGEKIAQAKKKNAEKKLNGKVVSEPILLSSLNRTLGLAEGSVNSVLKQSSKEPVPLILESPKVLQEVAQDKNMIKEPLNGVPKLDGVKPAEAAPHDSAPAARDILGVNTESTIEREKREIPDESCKKSAQEDLSLNLKQPIESVIKDSKVLSPPIVENINSLPELPAVYGNNPVRQETRRRKR